MAISYKVAWLSTDAIPLCIYSAANFHPEITECGYWLSCQWLCPAILSFSFRRQPLRPSDPACRHGGSEGPRHDEEWARKSEKKGLKTLHSSQGTRKSLFPDQTGLCGFLSFNQREHICHTRKKAVTSSNMILCHFCGIRSEADWGTKNYLLVNSKFLWTSCMWSSSAKKRGSSFLFSTVTPLDTFDTIWFGIIMSTLSNCITCNAPVSLLPFNSNLTDL